MASAFPTPASLPATRRRESSDEFGTGSLGSIGGSAVGFNGEEPSASGDKMKITGEARKPIETLEVRTSSMKSSSTAPSRKRPAEQRKDSVDFSFLIGDSIDMGSDGGSAVGFNGGELPTSGDTTKVTSEASKPIETLEVRTSSMKSSSTAGSPSRKRPAKQRKDSVDISLRKDSVDFSFLIGDSIDMGSDGGSAVGFNGEEPPTSGDTTKVTGEASNPIETLEVRTSSMKSSSTAGSPSRKQPAKQRKDSVDISLRKDSVDFSFLIGDSIDMGSDGGNAVGFNGEEPPTSGDKTKVTSEPSNPIETLEVRTSSMKSSSTAGSPSRKRPAKQRKGSVDFSILVDDSIDVGSDGGSALGCNGEEPPASGDTTKVTGEASEPRETLEVRTSSMKASSTPSSTTSKRPAKRHRGSVDFTFNIDDSVDLGSDGRSAVGFNGEEPPPSGDTTKVTGEASEPLETLEVRMSSMKSASTTGSPFSKRPAKRRKGSVDFTFNIDDSMDLGSDARILPTMDVLPSMDSLPSHLEGPASPLMKGSASVASSHTYGMALALDHLDALGAEAGEAAAKIKWEERARRESISESSNGTFTTNNQRILLESFMSFDEEKNMKRRERLESWGGMSDISMGGIETVSSSLVGGGTATAAALAASALQYSSLADDLTAAVNFDGNYSPASSSLADDFKPSAVPGKIALNRNRLYSVTSAATEPSISLLQIPTDGVLSNDLQAFVKAAMASVGDQLAELVNVAETGVSPGAASMVEILTKDAGHDSEMSSVASPMIGAASDVASKGGSVEGRPRSTSITSALNISVDYDAVAAAVNAAQAATGAIDLSAIAAFPPPRSRSSSICSKTKLRRQLPTAKFRSNSMSSSDPPTKSSTPLHTDLGLPPIPKSNVDERDMEIIRERARAAAGYVPPSSPSDLRNRPPIPKKKIKQEMVAPHTPGQRPSDAFSTPRISNASNLATPGTGYSSMATQSSSMKGSASKGQSSQKWDSMFDCLLEFIQDRKKEDIIDMSEEEIKVWVWDGNVPTTYKSDDGKALGRWVNNQRSAKSKGVLKDDREDRLINAGLKWSVLASNSWNEMLEELRIYVNDQTNAGRKWDGNVPTNYRIKPTKANSKLSDEDKNLGRWVNRQRSLYQAGKLRKDRQLALEKVGLKWSMLATTSWDSMFDSLAEYVESKTKEGGTEWDGNVPANYRTGDNPPRALGRWINRQRSAYVKDKLKNEYVEMLNKIGLKWSVHERRPISADQVPSSNPFAPISADQVPSNTPSTHSSPLSSHSNGQETPKLPTLPESKLAESKPESALDSKPESALDSKPESKPDSKPEDAPESKSDEKDVPEISPVPDKPQSGGANEPQLEEADIKLEEADIKLEETADL